MSLQSTNVQERPCRKNRHMVIAGQEGSCNAMPNGAETTCVMAVPMAPKFPSVASVSGHRYEVCELGHRKAFFSGFLKLGRKGRGLRMPDFGHEQGSRAVKIVSASLR